MSPCPYPATITITPRVNYNDECLDVLHRVRTKQHLVVLEALYVVFYKPTLCKQNPKHSLNLIGDNCCLTRGGINYFFLLPLGLAVPVLFSPHLLINLSVYIVLNDF